MVFVCPLVRAKTSFIFHVGPPCCMITMTNLKSEKFLRTIFFNLKLRYFGTIGDLTLKSGW